MVSVVEGSFKVDEINWLVTCTKFKKCMTHIILSLDNKIVLVLYLDEEYLVVKIIKSTDVI